MGIRTPQNPLGSKTFTDDVLKIEKCGPNEDYLTVIDVPGIFRLTTEGVTSDRDKQLVIDMVKEYIRDSRTIILAVLPCNVDVMTQEILALAETYDPTGERTIGVLTKPDLVKERSAKAVVCNLVEGKRKPLTLGYYVVRSRGGDEEDNAGGVSSSIYEREQMFREQPWSQLPDDRIGVDALRERLQELLGQITDRAFPKLRAETRQMLTESEEALAKLGPPRQSEREQQQYLVSMAGEFQKIVRAALNADYSTRKAFSKNEFRLITSVVNITEEFNASFRSSAHAYSFNNVTSSHLEEAAANGGGYDSDNENNVIDWSGFLKDKQAAAGTDQSKKVKLAGDDGDDSDSEDTLGHVNVDPDEFPDLSKLIISDYTKDEPTNGIMKWISGLHIRSRGLELGTFGPALLSSAFREQSTKWESLARQYLSKVILTIHKFILLALREVCVDERASEELLSSITNDLLTRYTNGMSQAIFLVEIERDRKPYTLNHYFNSNLQKARGLRMKEALRSKARPGPSGFGGKAPLVIDLDSVQAVVCNRSNAEQTAEEIHDILQAYYRVACKRFIDNVYHQAVDHYLLSGPMSPLALFTERWVLDLDADKLAAIAGESRMIRERREKLRKKIDDLEIAMKILR